jgi:hypothetical protein
MLRSVGASRSTASTRLVRALKVSGLAALFAAGVFLADAMGAGAQTTETTTTVPTAVEPTTSPTTTVITTATVEQTTNEGVVPADTTSSTSSSGEDTPAWVWVLLGILAVGLIAVIALLARRGGGSGGVPAEDRRRHLDTAISSWTAQGWALESQGVDSAVLVRGGERLLVSVDQAGRVSTLPLPNRTEP